MPKQPAGIFEDDLDLSDFTRKDTPAIKPKPEILAAAEAHNFQSREPRPKPPKKADRRYRTGRNIPLATKISENARDLLYGMHEEHRDARGNPEWTIGEIIEFGLEAFKRELDNRKAGE